MGKNYYDWCRADDCRMCRAITRKVEAEERAVDAIEVTEVPPEESVTLYRVRRKSDGLYYRTHIWNRHWDQTGSWLTRRGLGVVKGALDLPRTSWAYEVERWEAVRSTDTEEG